jgi:SSS family solute:Na+ symporter
MWFGITAAAFLSMYVAALFWKRATKAGAIAGLVGGSLMSLFWLLFGFKKSAEAVGICQALTGKVVIINTLPWLTIDPIVISLPLAALLTVLVSLMTKPPEKEHMDKCFAGLDTFKGK